MSRHWTHQSTDYPFTSSCSPPHLAVTQLLEDDPRAESVLRFVDTKQVLVTAARVLTPSPAFLQLEGSANENILIDGGDLSKAASPLTFKDGATEGAVRLRK